MNERTLFWMMVYYPEKVHFQFEDHCSKQDGGDITKLKIVRRTKEEIRRS